jgi:ribonuclease HI
VKIKKAVIFTDGLSRGNPGPAAIGAAIKDEQGGLIASLSQSIGHTTNNQAEYRAVIAALEQAIKLGFDRIEMFSDSELIVRQINGQYRIKAALLKPLHLRVRQLQSHLKSFSITHIPRERNFEADRLANIALG